MNIRINAQLCTGCRICELICSFTKEGAFNPTCARIRIFKKERTFVDVPVLCRNCPDPACVAACPADALKKNAENVISVDEESCIGCGYCRDACPYGAVSLHPLHNTAMVCDLCQGDPQCAAWCPTGALTISRSEEPLPEAADAVTTARSLIDSWGIAGEEGEL